MAAPGLEVTIDQAAGQADPARSGPVRFTVVFSDPVTDFTRSDVVLSGTAPGSLLAGVQPVGTDHTTYEVSVSGMSGPGTVIATIPAGVAHDAAGHANAASTSTDNSITFSTLATTTTTVTSDHAQGSTYGEAVRFTATVSAGSGRPSGSVQFQIDGTNFGSAVTLVNGAATSPVIMNLRAGSHTITALYSGDSNSSPSSDSEPQSVAKAHLTVKASSASRTYGQANPAFTSTLSGFVNGETATSAGVTGSAALSTTATATSPVSGNPYPITVAAGSLAAANYDFAILINGALTVTKAHLTVTARPVTKPYGAAVPTLPYTITGFLNGETVAAVRGAATLTTTATASSPVGMYPITVRVGTLAAGNYDFPNLVSGLLSVVATTTTTVRSSKTPTTYGTAVTFTATVTAAPARARRNRPAPSSSRSTARPSARR